MTLRRLFAVNPYNGRFIARFGNVGWLAHWKNALESVPVSKANEFIRLLARASLPPIIWISFMVRYGEHPDTLLFDLINVRMWEAEKYKMTKIFFYFPSEIWVLGY